MYKVQPKYPVYIPSKSRYDTCYTAKFFALDGVPFRLVVEPQEADAYRKHFGSDCLLVLPWCGNDATRQAYAEKLGIENGGLIAVRNWIKEHSIAAGYERHWQFDDNITKMYRRYKSKHIVCNANSALRSCEDFVDRYSNVAIAGFAYEMFVTGVAACPPFNHNVHVYSASLINNSIPHKWRIAYNDDTDICLQVLADGWCTVLLNAFMIKKLRTMIVKGGNTDDLYQGDGRLRMARSLERLWPGVVTTCRRHGRPQHVIANAWRKFDTPLKLKPGIDLSKLRPNEYGLQLVKKAEPKHPELKALFDADT